MTSQYQKYGSFENKKQIKKTLAKKEKGRGIIYTVSDDPSKEPILEYEAQNKLNREDMFHTLNKELSQEGGLKHGYIICEMRGSNRNISAKYKIVNGLLTRMK